MLHLRDVLEAFEEGKPLSLAQMARHLNVQPSALEGMIEFWVRKGKLRLASYSSCGDCGSSHHCPVGVNLPKRYERVSEMSAPAPACPHCQQ